MSLLSQGRSLRKAKHLEAMMSQFQNTAIYQSSKETARRKHPEHGFALVLICVALALVVVSAVFPDAVAPSGEFSLIGP